MATWGAASVALPALGLVSLSVATSCDDDRDTETQGGAVAASASTRLQELVAAYPHQLSPSRPGSRDARSPTFQRVPGGLASRCEGALLAAGHAAGTCPADVLLPASADEPASIHEARTAVGARFAVRGASPSAPFVDGALALYRDVLPGVDLVHRASAHGTEDFFRFEERPRVEAIRYDVELDGVRALRLVGGVLELLDRAGVPRVRVTRPYVIDAAGAKREATLDVEGCPVDRDPRAPWSRPVETLVETECVVVVDWSASGASYPLLVDPDWQEAGNMINARTHHSATFLTDIGILLAGGFDVDGAPLGDAEIMCPAEICSIPSFAETDGLGQARGAHTATRLPDGDVLVTGGRNARDAGTALAGTAIYDTSEGAFGAGPAMTRARDGHTATLVDGKVLVAGGDGTSPSTAEVFDPRAGDFEAPLTMTTRRGAHAAESLADPGLVLLVGGIGNGNFPLQSAEIYDAETDTFTAVTGAGANMTATRAFATATLLEDGRVLVTGGTNGTGIYYSTADIFEPDDEGGGRFRQQPVVMEAPRAFHAATKLLGEVGVPGKVLLTGGFDGDVMLLGSEVFDAEAVEFSLASTMNKARAFHSATLLPSGQVVVGGGGYDLADVDQPTAQSTEILQRDDGEPCAESTECASGFCPGAPNGICCDQACEATCETCVTGACETVPDDTTVKPVCSDAVQFLLVCVEGEVSAGEVLPCEAFGCDGDECATECADDSLCSDVGYCSGTTCLDKQEIGAGCTDDRECIGGFCTDGVCCNARCDDICQACNVDNSPGVCQQHVGPPLEGKGTCDGAGGPCEGTCGTKTDACDYVEKPCTEGRLLRGAAHRRTLPRRDDRRLHRRDRGMRALRLQRRGQRLRDRVHLVGRVRRRARLQRVRAMRARRDGAMRRRSHRRLARRHHARLLALPVSRGRLPVALRVDRRLHGPDGVRRERRLRRSTRGSTRARGVCGRRGWHAHRRPRVAGHRRPGASPASRPKPP